MGIRVPRRKPRGTEKGRLTRRSRSEEKSDESALHPPLPFFIPRGIAKERLPLPDSEKSHKFHVRPGVEIRIIPRGRQPCRGQRAYRIRRGAVKWKHPHPSTPCLPLWITPPPLSSTSLSPRSWDRSVFHNWDVVVYLFHRYFAALCLCSRTRNPCWFFFWSLALLPCCQFTVREAFICFCICFFRWRT